MTSLPLNMQKLTWAEARADVYKVNPELAAIVDEIDPGPEFALYKAKYVYGNIIVKNGQLQLPLMNGDVIPASSSQLPTSIINDLHMFNDPERTIGMPPGILLNNIIEIYYNGIQFVPSITYKPGNIFGLWRTTVNSSGINWHMSRIGCVSAGARSLMMLPKITDAAGYKRLRKEFGLQAHHSTALADQWLLFTELAQHPEFPEPWSVELLFLSKRWIEQLKVKRWQNFWYHIILDKWQSTDFWRNQWLFDYFYSCMQQSCNLKPDPYLADTATHLFSIGAGVTPAFAIANDNFAGPIRSIQNIFQNIYGLKSHAPIMLHSKTLDITDKLSTAYYSLQIPTTSKFSPRSRQALSNMAGLREIKYIMEKLFREMLTTNFLSEEDKCRHLVKNFQIQYFHPEDDPMREISSSSLLLDYDPQLRQELARFPGSTFPDSAPFFHGCIFMSSVHKDDINIK